MRLGHQRPTIAGTASTMPPLRWPTRALSERSSLEFQPLKSAPPFLRLPQPRRTKVILPMRIISGRAGGIRLSAPEGRVLRPTEDRVKESMFSTIGDLTGSVVVDLFAGVGGLGLEALSRGAAQVILVECNREHCEYINRNLAKVCKAMGEQPGIGATQVVQADVRQAPTILAAVQPDLILADPPYHQDSTGFGAAHLLNDENLAQWAGHGCLLVLEHAADAALPWHPASPWQLLKNKRFGNRAVSFARLAS